MKYNLKQYLGYLIISAVTVFAMIGCASSGGQDLGDGSLDDQLVMFTVKVQAGQYVDALDLVTYNEQQEMLASNGDVSDNYKHGMRALRVSAMKQMNMELDRQGKIVGMLAAVETASKKLVISEEQKALDLKDIEARGVKRRADQAVQDSIKVIEDAAADKMAAEKDAKAVEEAEKVAKELAEKRAKDPEYQAELENSHVDGPSPVDLEMGADAPVDLEDITTDDGESDENYEELDDDF